MKNHRDWCMDAFDTWLNNEQLHLQPAGKLLDIGARDDCMRVIMGRRGLAWTGIDPFPQHSSVDTGTFEKIPFEDNSFDIVFACHAFEHCEHPIEALKEMQRVLKPEGKLFLATPFPCKHHIIDADFDHIMVLMPMQMARLCIYTGWKDIKSVVHEGYPLVPEDYPVQNHAVITTARKP